MSTLGFYPAAKSRDQVNDLVCRAAWFFANSGVNKIILPVERRELAAIPPASLGTLDPEITSLLPRLHQLLHFGVVSDGVGLAKCLQSSDQILRWQVMDGNLAPPKGLEGRKIWNVDADNTRLEGSFYVEAFLSLEERKEEIAAECRKKFASLADWVGKYEKCYVLATGPSLERYKQQDFTNALSIICNSAFLDRSLMKAARPKILTFADPIFHFGPSLYAGVFRRSLREAARLYDFKIVIPFKYYALFVRALPELEARTVGIPHDAKRPWNFDLNSDFQLRTTANVLTYLMLPLACTFAKQIGVLGCDGRPLSENAYFWGHNPKAQLNDKMENIKQVHPGFFKIDYNDYYSEHCETLERQFSAGESVGKSFTSLAFSHIPALQARTSPSAANCAVPKGFTGRVFIVDPDAQTWSGHYMAYNEKLAARLKADGCNVTVLCRKDLDPDILSARPDFHACFTRFSWQIGNPKASKTHADVFEAELSQALDKVAEAGSEPLLIYMYCGGVEHAEILKRQGDRVGAAVHINLFWLSSRLTEEYARSHRPFFEQIKTLQADGSFVATAPTQQLGSRLAQMTGCRLPSALHPSTGVADTKFHSLRAEAGGRIEARKPFTVLFPSAPRPEKGYSDSCEAARILCSGPSALRCIVKHAPNLSTPADLSLPIRRAEGMEVIEGALCDEEFLRLFARSHIVVLPYTPEAFAERTSGLLIDALYFGLPCVVIRGTWLSDIVEESGCGVAVDSLSAPLLAEGARTIADNYNHYKQCALDAGASYFKANSWLAFSKFLRAQGPRRLQRNHREASMLGPFHRSASARVDETAVVAKLLSSAGPSGNMIDVGAHHGSALSSFLNSAWNIWAFEPDRKNRAKLLERLGTHKNRHLVTLDTRCVSNASQSNLPFFQSDESTGISGLSAFRDTHIEAQRVDTVSLKDFFAGQEMPEVDFLKIDTEGHDLFVLQGFPWDRNKPRVIECEFEDLKTKPLGYTTKDMADFLVGKGYTVYVSEWHPILRYGQRHDWHRLQKYPCDLACDEAWGNLLAFADAPNEQELADAIKAALKIHGAASPPESKTASASPSFEHTRQFVRRSQNEWVFTDDPKAKQQLLIANFKGVKAQGRKVIALIVVESDQNLKVTLSLGRTGNTAYEGTSKHVVLPPNQPKAFILQHYFKDEHSGVKVQLDVKHCAAPQATISIKHCALFPSAKEALASVPKDSSLVREANRNFREKRYPQSAALYAAAARALGLNTFEFNARQSLKRLGITDDAEIAKVLNAWPDC